MLVSFFGMEDETDQALKHLSTDPVMAEYITIMIINNKTAGESKLALVQIHLLNPNSPAQITSELEDCEFLFHFSLYVSDQGLRTVIGSEFGMSIHDIRS